jgi:hypothetical protein
MNLKWLWNIAIDITENWDVRDQHEVANENDKYFIRKQFLTNYSTLVVDIFVEYIKFIMNDCYKEIGAEIWCGRLELSSEGLIHFHALFKIKEDIVSEM